MCSLSPFPNPLPPIHSEPSLPRLNQNSVAKSHVKWSTPLTHIKIIPAREAVSAAAEVDVPQCSFQNNEVGTIAGAMEGLDLSPTASHTSTKPPANALPPFHPSPPPSPQPVSIIQAAIPQNHPHTVATLNPNLRFILAAHNKAKGLQKSSDITDKRFIDTVTEHKTKTVSGPVNEAPSTTTLESNTPLSAITTIASDILDFTFNSDEEDPRNQESSGQKQRNTPTSSDSILANLKINAKKRRVIDVESSDSDSDGPRKRRKGASHAADINRMARRTQVHDGPGAIAQAFNNVTAGNQVAIQTKPASAPPRERQSTNEAIGVPHAARIPEGSISNAVATSSKVRVEDIAMEKADEDEEEEEDMDDEDDEDSADELQTPSETGDHQGARVYASMVSRKVSWWADKLKKIHHARVESLFEEKIALISAREILELLRDIDEHKNWATRVEVENARLERLLDDLVRHHLKDGSDAKMIVVRIMDNFAQRFRGARYPPSRR